eukprot:g14100.t1
MGTSTARVQIDAIALYTATSSGVDSDGTAEKPLLADADAVPNANQMPEDNAASTCMGTPAASLSWWDLTSKTDAPGATMEAVHLYRRRNCCNQYTSNAALEIYSTKQSSDAAAPDKKIADIGAIPKSGGTIVELGTALPVYRLRLYHKVGETGHNGGGGETTARVQIDAIALYTPTSSSVGNGEGPATAEKPLLADADAMPNGDLQGDDDTCMSTNNEDSDASWWDLTSKTDAPGATMEALHLYARNGWTAERASNAMFGPAAGPTISAALEIFSTKQSSDSETPDLKIADIGTIADTNNGGNIVELGTALPVYRLRLYHKVTTAVLSASDLEIVAGATAEQLGPASGYRCTQDNAAQLSIKGSAVTGGALEGREVGKSHDGNWDTFFSSAWQGAPYSYAQYGLQSVARITLIEITEDAKLWENHCADKAGFSATKDDGLPWTCQTDIMEPGTANNQVDQRLRTNFAVKHVNDGKWSDCYRMRLVDEGSGSHVFNPRPDLDGLTDGQGADMTMWTVQAWCNVPKVYAENQSHMKMYREKDPLKRLRARDVRLFGYPGAPPAAFVSEWIVRLKDGPKSIHSILFAIPSKKSEVLYRKSGAKPVAQEIKLAVDTGHTDAGGDTPEQNMLGLVTLCGVEITIEVPATVTTTTTVITTTTTTTTTTTKIPVFKAADVFYNKQRHARGATVLPVMNAIGNWTFPLEGGGAKPLLTLGEMRNYIKERNQKWLLSLSKYTRSLPLNFPAGEVLIALDVLLDWRDQGWGNQKGGVRVELRRGEEDSGSTIAGKWFEFAPHRRTNEIFALDLNGTDQALVINAQDGDYYRLGARVGEYPHKLYLHSVFLGVKYGTPPSTSSPRQLGEL